MTNTLPKYPLTFTLAKWYGIVFSAFFIVYGAVKMVLGFMDHIFTDFSQSMMALIIGLVLAGIVWAYRETKTWGWYGMVIVHSLVVINMLFSITDPMNIILLVLSAATIGLLTAPATREFVFHGR